MGLFAFTEITPWHWTGFVALVVLFIALDLGFFHRRAHVVQFKEALLWSLIWFGMAILFDAWLIGARGQEDALEFLTGYLIELSLSMDNVFVIALIFAFFRVLPAYQHRVLFWGILGALVMRGLMIGAGVAIIQTFHWMLYVMGAFLVLTGIKMAFSQGGDIEPERNIVVRLARNFFPVSSDYDGERYVTKVGGRRMLTPLMLVLLMVETTDLVFAIDSIPAIFAVTQDAFIVFTSNVFAILGLRSLYFVLANALGYFRFLKFGLSLVLVFIGTKMFLAPDPKAETQAWHRVHIPTSISLAVVAAIIIVSIIASVMAVRRNERTKD
jgi:tellurite resistance protein TerC